MLPNITVTHNYLCSSFQLILFMGIFYLISYLRQAMIIRLLFFKDFHFLDSISKSIIMFVCSVFYRFKGKVCNDRGTCECGECVQCFPSSVSTLSVMLV